MRRVSFVGRSLAAVGLLLGLLATVAATRVAAQADDVKLTIHVFTCPTDAEGDIFEACHDNRLEGVDFEIDGTLVTSDADGVVDVDNPPAGEVSIHELDFDAIVTAGKAFVYCSVQPGGSPVLVSRNDTDGKVSVDLPEDAEVHCDWYNRTSATGPTPTSEATETPEA